MKKLSIMLCVLFFIGCTQDEILEYIKIPENVVENPNEEINDTIPENNLEYVKDKINLNDNEELINYCVINKDSIWGLSK